MFHIKVETLSETEYMSYTASLPSTSTTHSGSELFEARQKLLFSEHNSIYYSNDDKLLNLEESFKKLYLSNHHKLEERFEKLNLNDQDETETKDVNLNETETFDDDV